MGKTLESERLLYIQDLFSSFSRMRRAGHLYQTIDMFNYYSKNFNKIYCMTYDNQLFDGFPKNFYQIPTGKLCNINNLQIKRLVHFLFSSVLLPKNAKYVELVNTTTIVPAIICKLKGRRLFLYHRWSLRRMLKEFGAPYSFLYYPAYLLDILAFKLADTIAVATPTLGLDVIKYACSKKIFLLPNYVDTELFKPQNTEKVNKLLIMVCRLHPQKNIPMVLEVMRYLPEFNLQIIGDGPLKDELIKLKNDNNINNVQFIGTVPFESLPSYLNKAEAFIFPTLIEGHPKTLIEAMACGLPCIGSNVEGIKEMIINGETGILCDLDVRSIKNTIINLFDDRAKMKRIGENAVKFVQENYSRDAILDRKVKLIKGELDDMEPLFKKT